MKDSSSLNYEGIVLYTFSDDNVRSDFLNLIKDKFKGKMLDQSSYAINSFDIDNARSLIKAFCSSHKLAEDDTIYICCTAHLRNAVEKEYKDKLCIIRLK